MCVGDHAVPNYLVSLAVATFRGDVPADALDVALSERRVSQPIPLAPACALTLRRPPARVARCVWQCGRCVRDARGRGHCMRGGRRGASAVSRAHAWCSLALSARSEEVRRNGERSFFIFCESRRP